MASTRAKRVFISCGQYAETEKALGKEIDALVRERTTFEPYLADIQTSLDGLTQNIFGELNKCVGLIAVMHHRGEVSFDRALIIRGSLWIEQEIAIAAFLRQVLDRDLTVRVYIEKGVQREGVRDKLQLNPIEFTSNEEVLSDLRAVLPVWERDISAQPNGIYFEIRHRSLNSTGEYRLQVALHNNGPSTFRDYTVIVEFPQEFILVGNALEVHDASNPNAKVYRRTPESAGFRVSYPGSLIEEVVGVQYYVRRDHAACENALSKEVVVSLYVGDVLIQRENKPVSQLLEG